MSAIRKHQVISLNNSILSNGEIVKIFAEGVDFSHDIKEVYSSSITWGAFRGYKLHLEQASFLICISGTMRFHFLYEVESDEVCESVDLNSWRESLKALYIPSGVKFGFRALEREGATVLNFSNSIHREEEIIRYSDSMHACRW